MNGGNRTVFGADTWIPRLVFNGLKGTKINSDFRRVIDLKSSMRCFRRGFSLPRSFAGPLTAAFYLLSRREEFLVFGTWLISTPTQHVFSWFERFSKMTEFTP
jgi:hypothetical protein